MYILSCVKERPHVSLLSTKIILPTAYVMYGVEQTSYVFCNASDLSKIGGGGGVSGGGGHDQGGGGIPSPRDTVKPAFQKRILLEMHLLVIYNVSLVTGLRCCNTFLMKDALRL